MTEQNDALNFRRLMIVTLIIMQNQSTTLFNASSPSEISEETKESLWQMKRWVLPEITSYLSMWYQIFLWLLIFNVLVHSIAAVVAFYHLRRHKIARFYGLLILALGFLGPITIEFIQEPGTSIQKAAAHLHTDHTSIKRILKEDGLKAYYCRWSMVCWRTIMIANPKWSIEFDFHLGGHINRHNCIYCALENPHKQIEMSLKSPRVCVWVGYGPMELRTYDDALDCYQVFHLLGAISTAVIAWIYYNSTWQMPAFYAMLAGLLQCILLLVVSFTQVLATL